MWQIREEYENTKTKINKKRERNDENQKF